MATAKQIDFILTGIRHPDTDEPLNGGKLYAYESGTTTLKNIYVGRDTTDGTAENPLTLSATGNAEVYGNGIYRLVITDSDDVTVYEFDNVEYVATVSESGVGPLTADLDFDGNKGINLGAGSEAGDTVEWQQWQDSVDTLTSAISTQTFLDLTDTPSDYSGQATKIPQVNAGETALEFVTPAALAGDVAFTDLSDTPSSLAGEGSKFVKVNSGGTALEFVAQASSDVPVGSIVLFAGSGTPPTGWAVCNGQQLDGTTYPDLVTAIGGTWATGGETPGYVRVPDLRGLFPKGAGTNAHPTLRTATSGFYTGSSVGQYVTDKFQGHHHKARILDRTTPVGYGPYGGNLNGGPPVDSTEEVETDSTYGTARVAAYTEPGHACVQYIIKVA